MQVHYFGRGDDYNFTKTPFLQCFTMFLVFFDDCGGTVTAGPMQHKILVWNPVVDTTGRLQCVLYACRYIISVVVINIISPKPHFYSVLLCF
jgi:hypothetical protein